MQITPLGVLLIGREAQASGGLPTPVVSVKFKDGTIEEMMSELSFDTDGDGGTVIGGGGVVISNNPLSGPLVISTYGMRNPEGKVVTKGEFSRFINLEDVVYPGKRKRIYLAFRSSGRKVPQLITRQRDVLRDLPAPVIPSDTPHAGLYHSYQYGTVPAEHRRVHIRTPVCGIQIGRTLP